MQCVRNLQIRQRAAVWTPLFYTQRKTASYCGVCLRKICANQLISLVYRTFAVLRRGYINTRYQNHPHDIASNYLYLFYNIRLSPPPCDKLICEYVNVSAKLHISGSLKSSKIKYTWRFISLATE